MKNKFREKYRIESNRWQFWDYSAPAHYFITICTYGHECILGAIENKKMKLSEHGKIVEKEFLKIPEYHKRVFLNTCVVMPNHVHCIITLGDYDFDNGISSITTDAPTVEKIHEFSRNGIFRNEFSLNEFPPQEFTHKLPLLPTSNPLQQIQQKPTIEEIKQYRKQRRKMLIPKIVGKFQMLTSKQMNIVGNTPNIKKWQPNYHDHVIRTKKSFANISEYIANNPSRWEVDKFNPRFM